MLDVDLALFLGLDGIQSPKRVKEHEYLVRAKGERNIAHCSLSCLKGPDKVEMECLQLLIID